MRRITAALAHAQLWLAAWWTYRRAPAVVAQYRALKADKKLVLADLARFCLANEDTFDKRSANQSNYDMGKRAVWLHIAALADVGPEVLESLKQETEYDER